ncbi:reverse transcriptase-like protein [Rossellomorea aquimaris]|uniref:reverse transcriptase-like protein n=1 Tax=Rossellomorea TaxID=2837508 RepID=UPI001CD457E1|nr:reverse transcriptase-like protein [Rossellomorea aquimaris]MCA1058401.1 reverse transcriptase-like protein [Rossellomorea aquimaris]
MLEVNIDGASAGNPGPSGAGIFIKNNGAVEKHSIPLGSMDNHEAEFIACKKALEICLEKQADIVWLRTDSQAVVQAIEKEFVRNEQYKPYLNDILNMTKQMNLFFVKWIPSKENKAADELARKAIHLN